MRYIPLTRGLKAKVDDEDFIFLSKFNWYADKSHYSSVVDDTETEAKAMVKKQLRRGKAKAATKRPEERRPSKRMQKRIMKNYYELQPSK